MDNNLELELFQKGYLQGKTPFESWFHIQIAKLADIREKEPFLFPYIAENSPDRWYSRWVINLFAPVERNTAKIFFPLSIDYESIFLGGAFGLFLAFRHFLKHRQAKYPQFRPGDCLCSGRNTHFYKKYYATHINPKTYFKYDNKVFHMKLLMGVPHALMYGVIGAFFCHGFFSQNFNSVERHFALFIGSCTITYVIYLDDRNYYDLDIHYDLYKHPELYGFAVLMFYTCFRYFRNYTSNIPIKRVVFG